MNKKNKEDAKAELENSMKELKDSLNDFNLDDKDEQKLEAIFKELKRQYIDSHSIKRVVLKQCFNFLIHFFLSLPLIGFFYNYIVIEPKAYIFLVSFVYAILVTIIYNIEPYFKYPSLLNVTSIFILVIINSFIYQFFSDNLALIFYTLILEGIYILTRWLMLKFKIKRMVR